MLVKIALVLLVVWALGIGGLYPEKAVHVLLLVGLSLLFLGVLKAQDAARVAARHEPPKNP